MGQSDFRHESHPRVARNHDMQADIKRCLAPFVYDLLQHIKITFSLTRYHIHLEALLVLELACKVSYACCSSIIPKFRDTTSLHIVSNIGCASSIC